MLRFLPAGPRIASRQGAIKLHCHRKGSPGRASTSIATPQRYQHLLSAIFLSNHLVFQYFHCAYLQAGFDGFWWKLLMNSEPCRRRRKAACLALAQRTTQLPIVGYVIVLIVVVHGQHHWASKIGVFKKMAKQKLMGGILHRSVNTGCPSQPGLPAICCSWWMAAFPTPLVPGPQATGRHHCCVHNGQPLHFCSKTFASSITLYNP